jgi:ELWxxDGT repeat protein
MSFSVASKPRRASRLRQHIEQLGERCLPAQTAIQVADINVGSPLAISGPGSNPTNLTNVNGTLYFTATNGTSGIELWKSDGTADGTSLVKDIRAGAAGSNPQQLTAVGDIVYFTADDGPSERKLWRSDGTEAGTHMVNDFSGGAFDHFDFSELTSFNGDLFFKATGEPIPA